MLGFILRLFDGFLFELDYLFCVIECLLCGCIGNLIRLMFRFIDVDGCISIMYAFNMIIDWW